MSKVVLIACSDIHLSDKAPAWRSAEPDWHAAMARPLQELRYLTKLHHCPLVVAGDIFDRFDPSPALINFALANLPFCYAVPGQHDLPHHNYQDIKKSAYWTLAEAGRVVDLKPGHPRGVQGARLYAFPWNHPLAANDEPRPLDGLAVAVIHKYVWTERCSYPGAPASNRLAELRKQLAGYDVAIFGDNHKGFSSHKENSCTVINCGSLMRRKSDERDYRPRAWLVFDDGHAEPHELDTSADLCVGSAVADDGLPEPLPQSQGRQVARLSEFLDGLGAVSSEPLDFEEAVQEHWRRESGKGGVLALLKEAMR
jgi:DNA repair exonuclease SbcCD nuclease subunit